MKLKKRDILFFTELGLYAIAMVFFFLDMTTMMAVFMLLFTALVGYNLFSRMSRKKP
jgi:hypothetical protein